MFVAASTDCFPDLSLPDALQKLVDLEYTNVEIVLRENGPQLKPSAVAEDLDSAVTACRQTHRLTPISYLVDIDTGEDEQEYYRQFAACCRLAKATKVFTLTVRSSELGTPFNAEVERLRELVRLSSIEGVLVGIKTEIGRITQDPDTTLVLCNNVKGLGVTLDPSHFVAGPYGSGPYDQLLKFVYHTHLRDSNPQNLQVRIGQGEIEYGRLATQLGKFNYKRALCVSITPQEDIDHDAEMRKLRLLLESLL